jgi:hypothetical protein
MPGKTLSSRMQLSCHGFISVRRRNLWKYSHFADYRQVCGIELRILEYSDVVNRIPFIRHCLGRLIVL